VSEQRKASEILLELENKLDKLIGLIETQNFNSRILSNKLNELMTLLGNQSISAGKITMEAVNTAPKNLATPLQNFQPTDTERQIPIFAEAKLPETNSPQGFRRTSRPETFSGEEMTLDQPKEPETMKFPVQIPKGGPPPGRSASPEVTAPMPTVKQALPSQKPTNKPDKSVLVQNAIPVHQRILDKNGKSIFLADVEIMDLSNGQPIHKTRTNGTGKWMASLGVGAYRVTIRKQESLSKDKTALEAIQDIQVDGQQSPLELKMLIIK
jgi:hypothetical protein